MLTPLNVTDAGFYKMLPAVNGGLCPSDAPGAFLHTLLQHIKEAWTDLSSADKVWAWLVGRPVKQLSLRRCDHYGGLR